MPKAAYSVFLKITFKLPEKLVGTCNFRVTSSHANRERRKADVRGFAEPSVSPFRLSSSLCSHRVGCAGSLSRHRGWQLPSCVWAAREGQANGSEGGGKIGDRDANSFQPCLDGWGVGLAWSSEKYRLGDEKGADHRWSRRWLVKCSVFLCV